MKINGIGVNNIINLYGDSNRNSVKNVSPKKQDVLEISDVGRSLSAYSIDNVGCSGIEIENIKASVSSGTYKVDSSLVAKKMLDNMKNREV
jgi:negative regulator of flagellin synthesis FlgM